MLEDLLRSHQKGLLRDQQPGSGPKFAEYGRQRICAHPECATVLSRYNAAPECSIHLTASPITRGRGGAARSTGAAPNTTPDHIQGADTEST